MDAYEETIRNTATEYAPWYVIPADNKWFTRIAVASAVITTLASLDLAYPTVSEAKLKELEVTRQALMNGHRKSVTRKLKHFQRTAHDLELSVQRRDSGLIRPNPTGTI